MKPFARPLAAAVALIAIACLTSCAPPPPPAPPEPPKPLQTPVQMIESAKAVDAAFVAAFNKADVDAIMATYWNSPDTVLYMPDAMEAKGFDAIKTAFTAEMPMMGGAQLAMTETHYLALGEDSVSSNGLWTMTMPAAAGAAPTEMPAEMKGRFSALLQRKDGHWVYVVDHASTPMPPNPAAMPAPAAAPATK